MSKIALTPNDSGTGTFTLASPNSNTSRTLTLPDAAGELLTSTGDGSGLTSLTSANLTGALPAIDGSGLTGIVSVPSGTVIYHASSTAPTGFITANGAALSRTTYADLFAAIGTTYGAGDGSTTFLIPDLRGEFMRGWDDGRGIDAGRVFGSEQSWAIENITGGAGYFNSLAGTTFSGSLYQKSSTSTADSNNGGSTAYEIGLDASREVQTSAETRPRNVALLACIKH